MADLIEPLEEITDFSPGIISYDCTKMGCNEEFKKENCLSGGKYCSMGSDIKRRSY